MVGNNERRDKEDMTGHKYKIGDKVRLKNEPDSVGPITGGPKESDGTVYYKVFFGVDNERYFPETDLELYSGGHDVLSQLLNNSWGPKETLTRHITFTKLRNPLRNIVYSFSASRTLFLSYQFKPVLKFLESPRHRLLIADEVGLGKTIEAGLILLELQARFPLKRVLIVCPSHLRTKWYEEMYRRFNEEFEILDVNGINRFLSMVEERGEHATLKGICSLQTLRNRGLLQQIDAQRPPLDMVIVDEAARLRNPSTLSQRLGIILGDCADAMLLLTATPVQMGPSDLFYLLKLLDPEGFENPYLFECQCYANKLILESERMLRRSNPADFKNIEEHLRRVESTELKDRFLNNPLYEDTLRKLNEYDPSQRNQVIELQYDILALSPLTHILTRTRKREVHEGCPKRTASVIKLKFTQEEKNFYDDITEYCADKCEREQKWSISPLVLMNLQRQMASSIPAMIEYQLQRLGSSTVIVPQGLEHELSDIILEDLEDLEDLGVSQENNLLAKEAKDLDRELESILRSYKQGTKSDSKFKALLKTLQELDSSESGRKVIIFSYFKQTLKYLQRCLQGEGYRSILITGDVPSHPHDKEKDVRGKYLKSFKEDQDIRILLSSEVGSEGLDLQFCHILINYDLPWNPMVVEQRIGRIDRIGQKAERIIVFNFSIEDTIEDKILTRLYRRIRIFEESIGDLETILGDCIQKLTRELLCSRLTPEEQSRKIDECAELIERNRLQDAEIEKRSCEFIGHDELFTEEIERIKSLGKYVTPNELEIFVRNFLKQAHPDCALEQTKREGIYTLKVSKELESRIREAVPGEFINFVQKMEGKGKITVTFKNDIAFHNQDVDFVSARHPLILAILEYYKQNPEQIHPVAKVTVKTHLVPPGTYFYVLFDLITTSARKERTLVPIFVLVSSGNCPNAEISEQLLAEIIDKGETMKNIPKFLQNNINVLWDSAEKVFEERLDKMLTNIRKGNDAVINNRLASLEESYKRKLSRKEEQLIKAKGKKQEERYIRMLEGTIRRLKEEYTQKRVKMEQGRNVTRGYDHFAAGIVEVTQ